MVRDGATPGFAQVVDILERQARHDLRRWASLGSGLASARVTRAARIGDDELRERVARLRAAVERLAAQSGDVPGIDEAREALAFRTLSALPEPAVEARLERAWAALHEALATVEAAAERAAGPIGHGLHLLTPEELDALADAEAEDGGDTEPTHCLARLVRLLDDLQRAASEAREVLAGRWHRPRQRGRPERIRGRRLSARLLGAAEGLGLKPMRSREPAQGRPGKSAADAVLAALGRLTDVADPVARAIVREAPQTYAAFEVRLIPACTEGPGGDPLLVEEREHGRRRGRDWT